MRPTNPSHDSSAADNLRAFEHVVYTVLADHGGAYAWIKRPGDRSSGFGERCADTTGGVNNTWRGDHPISAKLAVALAEWQRLYEGTSSAPDDEPAGGWRAFNKTGLDLAFELRRELGPDVRVQYAGQPAQPELTNGRWTTYVTESKQFVPRELFDRMQCLLAPLEAQSPLPPAVIDIVRPRALLHILVGQQRDEDALRYYRLMLEIDSGDDPSPEAPPAP